MSRWSIHQEEDESYTVRLDPQQVDLDEMPGNDPMSSDEEKAARAEANRGTQVGKPFSTRQEAAQKLDQLDRKELQDVKIAAAKELLGV